MPVSAPSFDPQWIAGRALVADVAGATGLPFEALLDELTRVPDSMLDLLAAPDGWARLADTVAARFGAYPTHYAPTVH
ncbi:hypothetical protein [Alteraurantiacibacter buctensis]|uniref:Uncharacterized protein n=1 Tax=Alteraurantiacibacter buctensis TaxID=1503981 RepID=A0A844YXT0_9SPHN|nr:hypothetical protein [Alteraurantiacibacter buctensis]MXO72369.1 hypothetical protein [Alteraurantiacibacter buctensis]